MKTNAMRSRSADTAQKVKALTDKLEAGVKEVFERAMPLGKSSLAERSRMASRGYKLSRLHHISVLLRL